VRHNRVRYKAAKSRQKPKEGDSTPSGLVAARTNNPAPWPAEKPAATRFSHVAGSASFSSPAVSNK
jgi:hypothetical protein